MRIAVLFTLTALPLMLQAENRYHYPASPAGDHVDDYHGTKVADPFRWLEDLDSPQTTAWAKAENEVTFDFLKNLPKRDDLRKRLAELYDYPRYSLPSKQGGHYLYTYNTGLQNQSPLYLKESLDGEARLLLDPNTLSDDGTVALTNYQASDDGRWLAYATSTSGSDWREIRVRDIATGTDTEERIKWAKFTGISWTHDSAGFFYSRYPEPAADARDATFSDLANQAVYYHRLGTPQSADVKFFDLPAHPQWGVGASVSEDGRYVFINIWEGTDPRNRLRILDLKSAEHPDLTGTPLVLVDELEAQFNIIGNVGPTLYLATDLDAPRQRIIAVDLEAPARTNWREVVPQDDDVIQSAGLIGGHFILSKMHDACSVLSTAPRSVKSNCPGSARWRASAAAKTKTICSSTSAPSWSRPPIITPA